MRTTEQLRRCGQSIWLDFISRGLIRSGELKQMVEHGDLTGVTSNPTIFEKAIDGGDDYRQEVVKAMPIALCSLPGSLEAIGIAGA